MRPLFDNRDFIEWIGNKNPDGRYVYDSCRYCLIAQYLTHRGVRSVNVARTDVLLDDGRDGERRVKLPPHWNAVAEGRDKTFGAAHRRALELLG